MVGRREVLVALGGAAAVGLAGCGCHPPERAIRVEPRLADVGAVGGGWEMTVETTVQFSEPRPSTGVYGLQLAAYGVGGALLDANRIGDVVFDELATEKREEDDCGTYGTESVTARLSPDRPPAYVGPRVEALDRTQDSAALYPEGLRHVGLEDATTTETRTARTTAPTTRVGTNTTAAGTDAAVAADRPEPTTTGGTTPPPPPNGTTTTATTTSGPPDGWPPATLALDDYEVVDVERFPWPPPDEQALEQGPGLPRITFRAGARCHAERRATPHVDVDPYEEDDVVVVRWLRPIPDGTCLRPLLTDAALEAGTLTLRVGLHEVPRAYCRSCTYLEYAFRATTGGVLDTVVVEHLDREGRLAERVRTDV